MNTTNTRKTFLSVGKIVSLICLFLGLIWLSSSLQVIAKESLKTKDVTSEVFTNDSVSKDDICHARDYYWVIYDNVCPYCQSATQHIKSLDWEGRFKFLSYRNPLTYTIFPKLSKEECEKDVHMVTPTGEILSGYQVFRKIIDNLTATKLLNPLLKNDYAERKLNEIYEKMVKERSCYYNKSDTCPLKNKEHKD